MSLIVSEIYDALIEAGTSKDKAKAAAAAVPSVERLATKEDIARLEGATREDIVKLEGATRGDIAKLERATREDIAKLERSTKEDIAKLERSTKEDIAKLDKRVAVLSLAVFSLQPAILALLVKLVFFP
jgi:hypothetical protein